MADIVIGVDIDSSAVRAVEIAVGNPSGVRRMGQVSLPAGAVRDGEVVDPAAVGAALRQLWAEGGFSGRSVRVAVASARVIVRSVEMPAMSDGDIRAALRFQLADFVPLPPEQTAFDFQQLDSDPERPDEQQVLLAAAPREIVGPLLEALKLAGLRTSHVDTAAVALARLGGTSPSIEAVVSIGSDMVVVIATRGGQPIYARALSNLADRHSEIAAEIGDSLAYFAAQPGGGAAQMVAITGAGDLTGMRSELEVRLGVPVGIIDPFAQLSIADGIERTDPLVRSLGLALGAALGAERGRGQSINLLADRSSGRRWTLRPILIGGVAVAVLLGGASLVRGQQQAISTARDERDEVEEQLTSARARAAEHAAERAAASGATAGPSGTPLLAVARSADIDWTSVATQLEAIGEPLGVSVTAFQGTAAVHVPTVVSPVPADGAAVATTAPPATTGVLGTVSITGTAPDLYVIAAWIDAVSADERFDAAWVNGSNVSADGTSLQFTGVLTLNADDRMAREHLVGVPS